MLSSVRGAAVLLTVLATAYLAQLSDQVRTSIALQTPVPVAVSAQPVDPALASFDREYFLARQQVVPVGRRNITLPILMYHYVRTPPTVKTDWLGYKLSVSPADFTAQMDWLSRHGYHAIDFNDVRAYFAGKTPLPANPVVITFDDGYGDLYTTAYPILAAHGFKAVAYIVSGFVGRPRYATAAQVVQMDENGIEIASHTVDHANLAQSTYASVMHELVDSKAWLERLLGHPVLDFAYPSGQFSAQVVNEVVRAGYDTAVTTMSSVDHSVADRYVWARVRVGGGESLNEFVRALGQPMPSTTITSPDIESLEVTLPPLARPMQPLWK